MKTILFQGDSITDCGRSRDNDEYLGNGYPRVIAGRLGLDEPGRYTFLNRAISGNRIVDLYARIKADFINPKPDLISIHIGINDVWHEVSHQNGVDAPKFEKIYDMLLDEVQEALPDVKLLILGPYVLKSTASAEHWDFFEHEVALRAIAARRVAEKHGALYVPLQERFDKAVSLQPEPYYTMEGVHPTQVGHELIARAWIEGFRTINL